MSTDLEQRIADLAATWEREAPSISLAEITGRRRDVVLDSDVDLGHAPADLPAADVTVEPEPERPRTDRRRPLAIAAALLVALTGAVVLARREPDRVDPVSPATTAPVPVTTASTPTSSTVPATTEPTSTVAPSTTTAVPQLLPADVVAERLAVIAEEQREALRAFTTIGFTVVRSQVLPDGSTYDIGGPAPTPARVVVRNDGSAAVVSESFGTSYYDAVAGSARGIFTNADGTTGYQQIDGQMDSSLALGIPTGIVNGVAPPIEFFANDVVAIEEDLVDGRATWRIDQYSDMGGGLGPVPAIETITWIDRVTGITLQTRSTGSSSIGEGADMQAITETVTLSDLVPNEPMPADFPNPFPPDANVQLSGDPYQYGAITYDAAATELGAGAVVPTIAADGISVERIVFGEGIENVGVTLVARWFDGFAKTELRVMRFPAMMEMPDSCESCTASLLEQLRSAPITSTGVIVAADGFSVSVTGDPDRIRSIIDSLVATG